MQVKTLVLQSLRVSSYYATLSLVIPAGGLLLVLICFYAIFAVINPTYSALMIWRSLEGQRIAHQWVPIEQMSRHLLRAAVATEDARFCQHRGIDWRALQAAFDEAKARGAPSFVGLNGGSTISMQVSKNLLLWPGRTILRKGVELAITPVMETMWSKRRILEVYLNIAEWAPGVFGAGAAAWVHFNKPVGKLTRKEAALLVAALPNPLRRSASRPGRTLKRSARRTLSRLKGAGGLTRCLVSGA